MSLLITELLPEQHKLVGIGKLEYLFNGATSELVIFMDGKEVRKIIGADAKLINDKIMCVSDELNPWEKIIDKKSTLAFSFSINELRIRTREREVKEARQISMWWLKETTGLSLSTIGGILGGFDHATVLHACKVVNNLRETDVTFRLKVERFLNVDYELQ